MQVGIDIVEIKRFNLNNINQFCEKYLTKNEQYYLNNKSNKAQTLAGIYACKEAVLKAFKIGIGNGVKLTDIEIFHENSVPKINLNSIVKTLMNNINATKIDVSISHSNTLATAICVVL